MPSSVTGRVLVSFWWLFSIIIASTYGGNLIAFLTVSREVLPFNDVHGLVRQDKYYWGFMNGTIPVQAAEVNKRHRRQLSNNKIGQIKDIIPPSLSLYLAAP